MESIVLVFMDIIVLLVILLICVYLTQDRRRFRVERQFSAVKDRFDSWVSRAAGLPSCAAAAAVYEGTRNISKKYVLLAELYRNSRGAEAETDCHDQSADWSRNDKKGIGFAMTEMKKLESELAPFCGVYNALAEEYNRRLMGRIRGAVMKALGFRMLPRLSFGEDI